MIFCLRFWVSWFLVFLVVDYRVLVSYFLVFRFWFLGFLVLKVSIACFLEDIGPGSKTFEILWNGPSHFFGARFFEKYHLLGFWKLRYINILCLKMFGLLLDCFRCPGVSNDKNNWFWGSGHIRKSRNHGSDGFWDLP